MLHDESAAFKSTSMLAACKALRKLSLAVANERARAPYSCAHNKLKYLRARVTREIVAFAQNTSAYFLLNICRPSFQRSPTLLRSPPSPLSSSSSSSTAAAAALRLTIGAKIYGSLSSARAFSLIQVDQTHPDVKLQRRTWRSARAHARVNDDISGDDGKSDGDDACERRQNRRVRTHDLETAKTTTKEAKAAASSRLSADFDAPCANAGARRCRFEASKSMSSNARCRFFCGC